MFGYRGLVAFLVAGYLLLTFEGCSGQDEDSDMDASENDADYKKTYVTKIERVLKGMSKVLPSSSSGRSFGGIEGFLGSYLPEPLDNIISKAENATQKGFGVILNLFEKHFHAIYPGTLWCGAGNIANDKEDVGIFSRTDDCCRDHDNCPSNIAPEKTKRDLLNNGIFTRSACSCDHEFYHCLRNARSPIAHKIGKTYFNILRPQCFELNYPIKSCAKHGRNIIFQKKCVKYNFDKSQEKELNWFDNPRY